MTVRWPPTALFGLHVDCGDFHSVRRVWLRLPTARFTCREGCDIEAFGAADVAHLTSHLTEIHAPDCPARDLRKNDDRTDRQSRPDTA